MKNILVELPIWATTVNIDWVPEVIYRDTSWKWATLNLHIQKNG